MNTATNHIVAATNMVSIFHNEVSWTQALEQNAAEHVHYKSEINSPIKAQFQNCNRLRRIRIGYIDRWGCVQELDAMPIAGDTYSDAEHDLAMAKADQLHASWPHKISMLEAVPAGAPKIAG